jgi:hypothetical protein
MIKHMRASIEGLLNQSTAGLGKLLEMDGKEARNILKEKLKAGELYIPCGDCEGFDPCHGCPGHPKVNGKEITIKAGMVFRNVHMPTHSFIVLIVTPKVNQLEVRIVSATGPQWTEKDWNLEHTQWAFEKGEYYFPK